MDNPTSIRPTVRFDATDPLGLARFWAAALGGGVQEVGEGEVVVTAAEAAPLVLRFAPADGPKEGKNVLHLDLVAEAVDHQEELVDQLVALGADVRREAAPDEPWLR